jgi:hypothetical protein
VVFTFRRPGVHKHRFRWKWSWSPYTDHRWTVYGDQSYQRCKNVALGAFIMRYGACFE